MKGRCSILADKIFKLVMLSMCIATISLTVTKSVAFLPVRRILHQQSEWLGALVNCPYCLTHWIAIVFVILLYVYSPFYIVTNKVFLDSVIMIFATTSLATLISGLMFFVLKTM